MGTMALNDVIVLQLNVDKRKFATTEIMEKAASTGASVLLLQEPWVINDVVYGLGTTRNRILTAHKAKERPRACIVVTDRSIDVAVLNHLSSKDCVVAHLTTRTGSFYAVSIYCEDSDTSAALSLAQIQGAMQRLLKIRQTIGQARIIIGADLNANSQSWGSRALDARGKEVESMLAQSGWMVINGGGSPPTYISPTGSSYIDATIVSQNFLRRVCSWELKQDWTGSPHQVLETRLGNVTLNPVIKMPRYNTRRANWTHFQEGVVSGLNQLDDLPVSAEMLDSKVSNLTTIFHNAAKFRRCIPPKKIFNGSVPWWSDKLTEAKRAVNKLRKRHRQARGQIRARIKTVMDKARKDYTRLLDRTRTSSWRQFTTVKGNEDAYGLVYKILMKRVKPDVALFSIGSGDQASVDWQGAAKGMLDTLIPDCPEQELVDIPQLMASFPDLNRTTTAPWSEGEVLRAIKRLPSSKAPGWDCIEGSMIKAMRHTPEFIKRLTDLLNQCMKLGHFPTEWKRGVIRVLLKSEDKDAANPNSYRPICLLPLLGKLLERLIRFRLEPYILDPRFSSRQQYGFRSGRSTEDALMQLRKTVAEAEEKYVMALLYDATKAFDFLSWESLMRELNRRGCPLDLMHLIGSFLSNRTVEIAGTFNTYSKRVTRGCPQGSILGPDFWNLPFDRLLRLLEECGESIECIAYADDLLIVIKANSRSELERIAQKVTDLVFRWFTDDKLMLSQTKTQMIMLKGSFKTRDPIVKLNGQPIKMVSAAKYLGVTFGHHMDISTHVANIAEKSRNVITNLSKAAGAVWGLKFRCLNIMYVGIIVAIMTYGACAWADLLKARDIKQLKSAQRYALLRVARAYKTASHDALHVVVGVLPIDLAVRERMVQYYIRKDLRIVYSNFTYEPQTNQRRAREQLRDTILQEWQARWQRSNDGRVTYRYLPNVSTRLLRTWIQPGYVLTKYLTGHGDFKAKLSSFALVDTDSCRCGLPETADHLLYECEDLEETREIFKTELLQVGLNWPPDRHNLTNELAYPIFARFVTAIDNDRQERI